MRSKERLHNPVCFHCQQSAEKYLKALMQECGEPIPRIHELCDLLSRLLPHHQSLKSLRRGLDYLTTFAVEFRYPGFRAKKRQAESALRWAERMRKEARSLLGVPSRKSKKKKSM